MRHRALSSIGMAIITIVLSGCSKDEGTPATREQPGAPPGAVGTGGAGATVASDEDFVRDVALKHMAEIELGRRALDTTANHDIKAFAQRLIDEHDAAGTVLKGAIAGTAIEWPVQLDEQHRNAADELAQKRGADFDREYLKAVVDGHQNLAAKLESRLDVQSLGEWKTAAAARTQSQAMPEPTVAMRDVAVRPAESGHESTMRINRWAAGTYPMVQKLLDTARTLENVEDKRN